MFEMFSVSPDIFDRAPSPFYDDIDDCNSIASSTSCGGGGDDVSISSSARSSSSSSSYSSATPARNHHHHPLRTSITSVTHCQKLLPIDFTPTPYTVVCGRGKRCAENVGNRRLQVIASMFIGKYSLAKRKEDKSVIVSEILEMVQQACPDKSFAFVRYSTEDGRWWEADNLNAREKIGTVLRDCLHSKYRSSTKSKLQRRKQRKETAKKAQMLENFKKIRNASVHYKIVPVMPIPQLVMPVYTK